ncbi:MAG: DUF2911 domain-containing protein [Bacteroidota bacterium]
MTVLLTFLKKIFLYFFAALFFLSGCENPEPQQPDEERRKSPIAIASTTHGPSNTYLKIVYGQPYKNNRDIFGELVPYGEVWRTGANEATELTTTKDITFGGEPLEAGTYALFTIPKKDGEWSIILNGELGQWGAFDYDSSSDVFRVDVPVESTEKVTEAFTIRFTDIEDDSTHIIMEWDQTRVTIPVSFSSD